MRFILNLLICAALALPGALPALAGAWPQQEGGYYLKIEGNYLTTGKELNFRGDRLDIFQERISFSDAAFSDGGIALYGEYGISSRVTALGKVPFKRLESEREVQGGAYFESAAEREVTTGFGDLDVGVRYGLFLEPVVVSLQGGLKLPLGYDPSPGDGGPPLGTGEVDSDLRVIVGKGFSPWSIYISAGAGYRMRGGIYHDEIIYEGELGMKSGRWLVKVGIAGVDNREAPQDLAGTPIVTPLPGGGGTFEVLVGDQDYTQVNPALSYAVAPGKWFAVELLDVVAGKNTVDGTTLSLGIILTR